MKKNSSDVSTFSTAPYVNNDLEADITEDAASTEYMVLSSQMKTNPKAYSAQQHTIITVQLTTK